MPKIYIFITLFILFSCSEKSSEDSVFNPEDWVAEKPIYDGPLDTFSLSSSNASETSYGVVASLDLLNILAFGDDYDHFYFINQDKSEIPLDEVICESGDMSQQHLEPNVKIELTYNDCIIGSEKTTGTLRLLVDETSKEVTIIADISIENISSGQVSSISGYYILHSSHEATFQLLLTNPFNEQIWFDDFKLRVSQVSSNYGIYYSGDVYSSDVGKLTVNTEELGASSRFSIYNNSIKIISDGEITFNTTLQNHIEFQYSDNYIPVIIPLDTYPTAIFNEINALPEAVITSETNVTDRNVGLLLSSINSSDINYEPLTFLWEVINKPNNSQPSIQQTTVPNFIADLPGEYTVKLTVTDTKGASTSSSIKINVLKNVPEGAIELFTTANFIGEDFKAKIKLDNDAYDEPFSYEVKFGPSNMAITSEGEISWDSVIPDYGKSTEVNFAVFIDNGDKHSTIYKTISIDSASAPIISNRVSGEKITSFFSINKGNRNQLYLSGDKLRKLNLQDSKLSIEHVVSKVITEAKNIHFQEVYDVNNDGKDDYLFSQWLEDKKQAQVLWIDGESGNEELLLSFDNAITDDTLLIKLIDYDIDNSQDLLISHADLGTKIVSLESQEYLLSSGYVFNSINRVCDFNNDGYVDIFSHINGRSVHDLKNEEVIFNSISFAYPIDNKGTNECNIAHYKQQSSSFKLYLIDLNTDEEKVIYDGSLSALGMLVGNFDQQAGEDIILVSNQLLIQGLHEEISFISPIDLDGEGDKLKYAKGYLSTFPDLNDDGIDEFIWNYTSSFSPSYSELGLYILEAKKLTELSGSLSPSPYPLYIENWDEMDILTLFSDRTVNDSATTDTVIISSPQIHTNNTYEGLFSLTPSIEVNSTYVYLVNLSRRSVIKQDLTGNQYWNMELKSDDNSIIINIEALKNGLVLVETNLSTHILHPETGEILRSVLADKYDSEGKVVFHSFNNSDYIIPRNTHSLLKVISNNNEYSIEELNIDDYIETPMNIELYSFIQSEQNAFELIAYYDDKKYYQILDLQTLLPKAKSIIHDGTVKHFGNLDPYYQSKPCFYWDLNCRNLIAHKENGNGYEVIDKLTGTVIWKSPEFYSSLNDLMFKENNNGIESALSFSDGYVYTFE